MALGKDLAAPAALMPAHPPCLGFAQASLARIANVSDVHAVWCFNAIRLFCTNLILQHLNLPCMNGTDCCCLSNVEQTPIESATALCCLEIPH